MAWDVGVWDNDHAFDWVEQLENSDKLRLLEASLSPQEVHGYYLERPEGACVLCAVDTILVATAGACSTAPEKVRQ